ncbi:hypothetical protein ACIP9H_33350 [Streptomyces sp. NPDC088732]|uniref:hypothetical protein n=1 Tax=Streptomyces sp. NPDC088732 TaxID=3365879 RepID=UPI0038307B63
MTTTPAAAPEPTGRDWTKFNAADFGLAYRVTRPVLAIPDELGTEALFGDEPQERPETPAPVADTLF